MCLHFYDPTDRESCRTALGVAATALKMLRSELSRLPRTCPAGTLKDTFNLAFASILYRARRVRTRQIPAILAVTHGKQKIKVFTLQGRAGMGRRGPWQVSLTGKADPGRSFVPPERETEPEDGGSISCGRLGVGRGGRVCREIKYSRRADSHGGVSMECWFKAEKLPEKEGCILSFRESRDGQVKFFMEVDLKDKGRSRSRHLMVQWTPPVPLAAMASKKRQPAPDRLGARGRLSQPLRRFLARGSRSSQERRLAPTTSAWSRWNSAPAGYGSVIGEVMDLGALPDTPSSGQRPTPPKPAAGGLRLRRLDA